MGSVYSTLISSPVRRNRSQYHLLMAVDDRRGTVGRGQGNDVEVDDDLIRVFLAFCAVLDVECSTRVGFLWK